LATGYSVAPCRCQTPSRVEDPIAANDEASFEWAPQTIRMVKLSLQAGIEWTSTSSAPSGRRITVIGAGPARLAYVR